MDTATFTSLHNIWRDSKGEKMPVSDVSTSDFLQRVRGVLSVTVIVGNYWSKNDSKASYLWYKQRCTWKKAPNHEFNLVERCEFESLEEFLEWKDIDENKEKIPTREDVESLTWEKNTKFISGVDYVFDDGENGIGVFQVTQDGELTIKNISEAVYVRIRTIRRLPWYSSEQISRLKKLEECSWLGWAKKEKIQVTPEYIEICGIKLKLYDEQELKSFWDGFEYDRVQEVMKNPRAPSMDEWQSIIDFLWWTNKQVYEFFREILGMKQEEYQTSTWSTFEQEFLMVCWVAKRVYFHSDGNEWPEWETYARYKHAA